MTASRKVAKLGSFFHGLDSAAIAFSGGVDSSVLAKTAYDALGSKAIAITIVSPTIDPSELANAKRIAKAIGIKHVLVKHDELSDPCFKANKPDRCYHCKKGILSVIRKEAAKHGIKDILEGTNAEDILGHRPGYRAVKEGKALSPLADLGLKKKDIREIARHLMLPNAEKPSTACLASRIPYGTPVTRQMLKRISLAESVVRAAGANQVRVRCFDDFAVIEVCPADFEKIIGKREKISSELGKFGFKRVVLDLAGYSTGSMGK